MPVANVPTDVTRHLQLGIETVAYTPVPANKQVQAFTLKGGAKPVIRKLRAPGIKHPVRHRIAQEWSEWTASGWPCYTHDVYALASVIKAGVTPTTVGTTGKKWTFAGSPTNGDAGQTLSFEVGSTVRAQKFGKAAFSEFGWDWSRADITSSGKVIGGQVTDGAALTASPTLIAETAIDPQDFACYADATSTNIGSTQLTGVLKASFAVTGRWQPYWPGARGALDYDQLVEDEPTFQLKLLLTANSDGAAQLAAMRANARQFLRAGFVGAQFEAGQNYSATYDLACAVAAVSEYKDEAKVVAVEYTFEVEYDAGWGKGYTIEYINQLAAL